MARPQLYPHKKLVGFDQHMLDAIDEWRRERKPIPTLSDAIRKLVELGLDASRQPVPGDLPTLHQPGTSDPLADLHLYAGGSEEPEPKQPRPKVNLGYPDRKARRRSPR